MKKTVNYRYIKAIYEEIRNLRSDIE